MVEVSPRQEAIDRAIGLAVGQLREELKKNSAIVLASHDGVLVVRHLDGRGEVRLGFSLVFAGDAYEVSCLIVSSVAGGRPWVRRRSMKTSLVGDIALEILRLLELHRGAIAAQELAASVAIELCELAPRAFRGRSKGIVPFTAKRVELQGVYATAEQAMKIARVLADG